MLQGELAAETAHLWVADKTTRIAWYQKLIEDLDSYLADDDLDPRLRHRYSCDVATLHHRVAEEKCDLRSNIEIDAGPKLKSEVIGRI